MIDPETNTAAAFGWNWLVIAALGAVAIIVVYNIWKTSILKRASAAEVAGATRKQLRRAWVLIAGTTIILVGVVISPLPGPGLSVLGPIGLALIATEFVWARKLLEFAKTQTSGVRGHIDVLAAKSALWLVALVVGGYWAAVTLIALYDPVPQWLVWPAASIGFAPIFLWAYRAWLHRPGAKQRPGPAAGERADKARLES